jgi:cardiolipin synthase A/B
LQAKWDVRCLIQPDDGVLPLINGINRAKKSIEIIIFRFNRREIELALANAVGRGVEVHALIAHTNRGGEKNLRDLEMRLLAAGVTVSRTDDELVRYHGKLMIVDRRTLYLLAFNFTYLDIERSRSFGIVTSNKQHVQEAMKLFEADTRRHPYIPGSQTFLVSPVNARKQLTAFIRGAKKELLIYDPEASDPAMIRTLEARARAGVTVNIIGKRAQSDILPAARTLQIRLHTRTIIRDGAWAFTGSQSLRAIELDARREVGIIFRDPKVVARLVKTFREDWDSKGKLLAEDVPKEVAAELAAASAAKVARKVARAVANDMGPVAPIIETSAPELNGKEVNPKEMEENVKDAVKDAVRAVVHDFVEQAAQPRQTGGKT